MNDELTRKLLRMRAALTEHTTEDLSRATLEWNEPGNFHFDANGVATPAQLENAAYSMVNNMAFLKDALKKWCVAKGVPFEGDNLINSNRAVAIVHDLWNADKHHGLSKPPRSGFKPELDAPFTVMVMVSDPVTGIAGMSVRPSDDGPPVVKIDGSSSLQLRAFVRDEHGKYIGELSALCSEAADAWEQAYRDAGVTF